MSGIVFDSGPLITLTMNNLLWLVKPLKRRFNGSFFIPESVKAELVDNPLRTKRFKFEALQVLRYIDNGTLTVLDDDKFKELTLRILSLANNCFSAKETNITIMHYAEAASIAAAKTMSADAIALDERVTRELIENPDRIAKIMEHKLHTKISINQQIIREIKKELGGMKVIRSVEMVARAFELKLLDRYAIGKQIPEIKRTLLDSVLWGAKIDGCAVSEKELRQLMKIEGFRPF
ncbi:MAG: hypothetical protein V1702_06245 [Candidatus Woesearchaeota archaeon]